MISSLRLTGINAEEGNKLYCIWVPLFHLGQPLIGEHCGWCTPNNPTINQVLIERLRDQRLSQSVRPHDEDGPWVHSWPKRPIHSPLANPLLSYTISSAWSTVTPCRLNLPSYYRSSSYAVYPFVSYFNFKTLHHSSFFSSFHVAIPSQHTLLLHPLLYGSQPSLNFFLFLILSLPITLSLF